MNNLFFAVVSSNRPDNVAQMESFAAQCDSQIHWFVPENQPEQYLKSGAHYVYESGGLVPSRNAALKMAFESNKICVMLDDDLKKCEMITNAKDKVEITFKQMINEMYKILRNSPCRMAGISPTTNTFYYNPKQPIGLRHFCIASLIMVSPCDLYFDEQFRTKEDYDYTLQHIKKFGGVMRINYLIPTFGHYTNKGGVVDYRTPELEQDSIRKLKEKWGTNIVKDNPRRPNEILIKIK